MLPKLAGLLEDENDVDIADLSGKIETHLESLKAELSNYFPDDENPTLGKGFVRDPFVIDA